MNTISEFADVVVGLEVDGDGTGIKTILHYSIHESLSTYFRIEVIVELARDCRPKAGEKVSLVLRKGGGSKEFSGIISNISFHERGADNVEAVVEIVHEVWRLAKNQDYHAFQNMTVLDICEKIFRESKIDGTVSVKSELKGNLKTLPYCVQYQESDWAFLSRLFEEQGIFCKWEITSSGTRLHLCNSTSSYEGPGPKLKLVPRNGFRETAGAVVDVSETNSVRPSCFGVKDFNHETPRLLLESWSGERKPMSLDIYEYPGGSCTKKDSLNLSKIGQEREGAQATVLTGESNSIELAPGKKFVIENPESKDFSGEYVVVALTFHAERGNANGGGDGTTLTDFRCSFWAMPADKVYRPKRTTPKPIIHGTQTAIVTGVDNQEIDTNSLGCIKVRFHWDRSETEGEATSCWIRVGQMWAGAGFGAMTIPRIGQEVIVSFLDGNPDRPVVVGQLYNEERKPPINLPEEKAMTTIRSSSTTGNAGWNGLTFDDTAGAEQFSVRAELDQKVEVGGSRTVEVKVDESISVEGERTVCVSGNEKKQVVGDAKLVSDGTLSLTAKMGVEIICGSSSIRLEPNGSLTINGSAIEVGASGTIKLKGSMVRLN